MKSSIKTFSKILLLLLSLAIILGSCELPGIFGGTGTTTTTTSTTVTTTVTTVTTTSDGGGNSDDPAEEFDLSSIPAYSKEIAPDGYAVVNGNVPFFKESEFVEECFEHYGDLDSLGRCTVAFACLGKELLPTEDKGSVSSVTPTGWHSVTYPETGSQSLYNRSHLIAWSLTGENANAKNLITGTMYMNQHTMQLFESQLLDYVRGNDVHVMYRATPIFEGDNLLASGVLLEAMSVEDGGEDIMFCVYVYNVQEGIIINYATGESERENPGEDNTRTDFDGTIYDFAGFAGESSKNTYMDRVGSDGWSLTYARLDEQAFIGSTPQVILNGNTAKVGSITSAKLSGGVGEIYFNYALCFSESNGVDLTVYVICGENTVAEYHLDENIEKNVKGELHWVLDTRVEGDFIIKIVNNCPSAQGSNKDRVSIWNLGWK